MNKIPSNVVDKSLYARIKAAIHKDIEMKGTRWGVYASNRLVREYKAAGGKYSSPRSSSSEQGTRRWYEQQWINICQSKPPKKLVPCGRNDIKNDKYPVCRPYHRVSPKTPTTYNEIDPKIIQETCRKKRHAPLQILEPFSNKKK